MLLALYKRISKENIKKTRCKSNQGRIKDFVITSYSIHYTKLYESGILYILVSLAVVRVVNWEELATSSAPMAMVAERGLGSQAHLLLSSIALFAITNTVLITLIAGSRIFYGMAREKVFPSILEKIHFKTKTPWIAVIVIFVTSVTFTFIGDIVIVANITVFAIVITFASVNLAVIVLRYTEPDIERKFKVPINIGKFPILPLFGLGISVYMTFQFEFEIMLVGLAIIASGARITSYNVCYTKLLRTAVA